MSYIFQPFRFELDAVIKKNAPFVKGRILDIGAGSYDRYSDYFDTTEYVRMNMAPGPNTHLVGYIEEIPAADASFDGIVCTQVLGDVYDVRKALAECHRVLKVGGTVLLTESFIDPLHDESHDYWRFTPHSLQRLFEEVGFTILVLQRIGGYHSTLLQLKTRYTIEKHGLYHAWYRPLANGFLTWRGKKALRKDAKDTSEANKHFAQGWIIVAKKK
jgi:ubiquinone/menaquinone biosynthesis C-methylase UbiE